MKLKRIFVLLLSIIAILSQLTVAVFAAPIDPARASSLKLVYAKDGKAFEGLDISVFRVADIHEDGTFDLCGVFGAYPINIHGVTSKSEWNQVCETLSTYINADGIEPDCISFTDENGAVVFNELLPGMYLTLSCRSQNEESVVVFESFLTVVPSINENGEYLYNVTAKPKSTTVIPERKEKEYTVVKHWRDNGSTGLRPENIEVDIFKDGVKHSTQVLNSDNNWSYTWTAADDGAVWTAVERDVSDKYTVTSVTNGNTLVITNSLNYDNPVAPPMGVETNFWPYILLMFFSGGILLLIALKLKRSA